MTIDPKDRKIQDDELTDEQTEQVAGGISTDEPPVGSNITKADLPGKFKDDSGLG